ncbi:MAG TPA: MASE1 domain-containing protein [Hyalangium sp.]|nr:MASE1 domain-containing protein [Hyalangium sp.]
MGGSTIRMRERIARAYGLRSILAMLALAVVFLGAGRLGVEFAIVHKVVSPVWPASGLGVAALWMLGVSRWPGLLLGAYLVNLFSGATPLASLGFSIGNTLEAVLAVLLLRRLRFSEELERVEDVVALVVGAGMGGALVSALPGTAGLVMAGALPASLFVETAWVWWGGDAMGIVVVTPVLLFLQRLRPIERRMEAVALGGWVLLVSAEVFSEGLLGSPIPYIESFLFFPLAVWAALRFGARGAAFTTLLITVISVWATVSGRGPFAAEPLDRGLLLVQLFIAINAITGLLLAAVSAGRRVATQRLELLATAVRGLSEGVVISELSPTGPRVVFANDAFCAMVGLGMVELLGCSPRDFAGELDPETRQRLDTAMREGEPFRGQALLKHRDGTRVHGELQLSPMRDAKGVVTHFVCSYRDVTATQELRSRLLATERVAAVGMLAAGVGHEIQNPLGYLALNLDAAERGLRRGDAPAEEVLDHLRDAREGAERIRLIVQDLRTFSREGGDERKPLDLREVAAPALRMVRHVLQNRARLVEDHGTIPRVMGSGARLGQVLLNLLVNAVQAIPPGEPERNMVRISTRTAPDGRAQVEISDTGQGILPEVLPHVFKPFFTTKPLEEGTGLGLSICQQIIQAHGGEILVRSEPGQGTVFTVLLPVAPEEVACAEPSLQSKDEPAAHGSQARRGRILIVDDEPRMAQSLRMLLEPAHEVVATTRGSEALEMVSSGQRFDLVVCDLQMPGTTGMDVYAQLRQQAPELAQRLVFMSGGAYTPDASAFIRSVPNRVLEKPVRPEVLLATIDAALAPRASAPGP